MTKAKVSKHGRTGSRPVRAVLVGQRFRVADRTVRSHIENILGWRHYGVKPDHCEVWLGVRTTHPWVCLCEALARFVEPDVRHYGSLNQRSFGYITTVAVVSKSK